MLRRYSQLQMPVVGVRKHMFSSKKADYCSQKRFGYGPSKVGLFADHTTTTWAELTDNAFDRLPKS